MVKRSNLNTSESPIKFIVGSTILLVASGIGVFWLTGQSKKETNVKENIVLAEPTKTVLPTPTVIEVSEESITITPTIATSEAMASPNAVTSPTLKAIEVFESQEGGFGAKYKSTRKVYEENESSGKRYIFYSNNGNITVHAGNAWSWINSGRTFSETLLVGGEKTYIYEISNQKIVDLQKGDKKYTIQCVHNTVNELKIECDKFLADFYFI